MKSKLQINTRIRRLIHYLEDMEKGLVQIPAFQRDFVWEKQNKLDLFDSLQKGYPIGSILFWQPEKSYGESDKIGPYYIPYNTSKPIYILDGFQRLSTIFGCLINPNKTSLKVDRKQLEQEFSIYYDLEKEEFFPSNAHTTTTEHQVPLYVLIDTFEFINFAQKLSAKPNYNELLYRAQQLATTLVDFNLPSIDIIGGEIDEAIDIFSRINSKGATITSDWILSALTYNQDKEFRLGTLIDELIDDLASFNFQKIKRDLIFRCIANSFGKVFFDQSGKIDQLAKRKDFIPNTKKTISSIKKAASFLFEELLMLDIKLLPYGIQFFFIVDFFNAIEDPTREQRDKLKEWFWITTYANYFTIYSLSKQREAYNTFQNFLQGKTDNPVYNDSNLPFSVSEFPTKINFGSVRSSALILFLLNYSNDFKPISSDKVEGFSIKNLFEHEKSIENFIPIIKSQTSKFSKSKDLFWGLEQQDENHDMFFISSEMKTLYKSFKHGLVSKEQILEKRKELIIAAEKIFVKKLGLDYSDDIHNYI